MKIHENGPDMDWREARLHIGAAEGAIRLLTFAVPAYFERERRERLEAWDRANEERIALRNRLTAMPIETFEEFKAFVETVALSYKPWVERFNRPILHFMWSDEDVIACDGENTARWWFDWRNIETHEDIIQDWCSALSGAYGGAEWNAGCTEHDIRCC